jgi:trehalose-phosphatase
MSTKQIAEKIITELKTRQLFAIFDRDGTLVPINPDPKATILQDPMRRALIKLNALPNVKVAILSARHLGELNEDFKKGELILSGNYGMELSLPGHKDWLLPDALKARDSLLKAKEYLQTNLPDQTKVILEDHLLVLCLHWHLTPAQYIKSVHKSIEKLKGEHPELFYKTLPTSYEVWPAVKWDKSNGLEHIFSASNCDPKTVLILYIGDSDSDEPAFEWTNKHKGISVRISSNEVSSAAQFKIAGPHDVQEILELLVSKFRILGNS